MNAQGVRWVLSVMLVAVVAALPGAAGAADAKALPQVRVPTLFSGTTTIIQKIIQLRGLDKKHGFEMVIPQPYANVGTYYDDFVAGTFQVNAGAVDAYAARMLKGVDIQVLFTMTHAGFGVLVRDPNIRTLADLKGKNLAAPLVTGTWMYTKALAKKFHGVDLEKDPAQVLSAQGPAGSITHLAAGRADAGVTWEPVLSISLAKLPGTRLLFDPGAEYKARTGRDLYFFVMVAHRKWVEANRDLARRMMAAYREAGEFLNGQAEEAATLLASEDLPKAAVVDALRSRRLLYVVRPAGDPEVKTALREQLKVLTELKIYDREVPDAFYADF